MFTSIEFEDFGPWLEGSVDLSGEAITITGASRKGKTSILRGICFVLWGTDENGRPLSTDVIHGDSHKATVTLTTGSGNRLRRSIDLGRNTVRMLIPDGEDVGGVYKSEKDWARDAIGALGDEMAVGKRRVATARLVLAPMGWLNLRPDGGNRELRDALVGIAGGGADIRETVSRLLTEAGHEMHAQDPVTPREAEDRRRSAKSLADQATGAVTMAETAAADARKLGTVAAPSDEAIAGARALGACYNEHKAHAAALEEWASSKRTAGLISENWEERNGLLGDAPPFSGPALVKAEKDAADALARLETAEHARSKEEGKLEQLEATPATDADLAKIASYDEHGGKCPGCKRKATKAQSDEIAILRSRVADRQEFDAPKEVVAARAEVARLKGEAETAKSSWTRKRDAVDELKTEKKALADWTDERGVLDRTQPEPFAVTAPVAPESTKPSEEDVAAARLVLETNNEARRSASASEGAVSAADERLAKAKATEKKASALAVHREAVVDAVRKAPSEQLRGQLASLGDLGTVSINLVEAGVQVLVNGRDVRACSSRGELVHADLCFRMALRRALGMEWFPVIVDNAQDWSEAWPEADGPVYFMQTAATATDGVTVAPVEG